MDVPLLFTTPLLSLISKALSAIVNRPFSQDICQTLCKLNPRVHNVKTMVGLSSGHNFYVAAYRNAMVQYI